MNHSRVMEKVSALSGVDAETCAKVVKALEKVMQDELAASHGAGGVLEKLGAILSILGGGKK